MPKKNSIIICRVIISIIITLFCFSLFKNIAYPLLWNDEAETILFGQRILKFGYPKVNDGKNNLYLYDRTGDKLAEKEKNNVYIGSVWGQYYFAVIPALLSRLSNDDYTKTALMRICFALIGFFGLLIMGSIVPKLFKNEKSYYVLLIFYWSLITLSISLVLHLRETRYYSLIIFLSALIFHNYFHFSLSKKPNSILYTFTMCALLFFLFNVFYPLYFIFCLYLALSEAIPFLSIQSRKKRQKNKKHRQRSPHWSTLFIDYCRRMVPVILSFVLILPCFIYYEINKISSALSKLHGFRFSIFIENIGWILQFFQKHEFLYLAITLKIILILYLYFYSGQKSLKTNKLSFKLSNSFTLFFIIHVLVTARTPFMFERYFILLIPILVIIISLDLVTFWTWLDYTKGKAKHKKGQIGWIVFIFMVLTFNALQKKEHIKGHIYELFHKYRGVFDFFIPYIKSNYSNPDQLIIATNYEESSLMYYLQSKVIVGYNRYNIQEDIKLQPDVILIRRRWTVKAEIFNNYLKKAKYKKILFSVYDYWVNNIPQIHFKIHHLYKTKYAATEEEKLLMFVKQ